MEEVIKSYIVSFFSGIFAGLVVSFTTQIMPINSLEKGVTFFLLLVFTFVIGLFCIKYIAKSFEKN